MKNGGGGMCVYLSTVIKKSAFLQVLLYSYSIGTMREFRDFKQFCSHSRLNSSKKATAILCLGIYNTTYVQTMVYVAVLYVLLVVKIR